MNILEKKITVFYTIRTRVSFKSTLKSLLRFTVIHYFAYRSQRVSAPNLPYPTKSSVLPKCSGAPLTQCPYRNQNQKATKVPPPTPQLVPTNGNSISLHLRASVCLSVCPPVSPLLLGNHCTGKYQY